jgi:hypothetical protein
MKNKKMSSSSSWTQQKEDPFEAPAGATRFTAGYFV